MKRRAKLAQIPFYCSGKCLFWLTVVVPYQLEWLFCIYLLVPDKVRSFTRMLWWATCFEPYQSSISTSLGSPKWRELYSKYICFQRDYYYPLSSPSTKELMCYGPVSCGLAQGGIPAISEPLPPEYQSWKLTLQPPSHCYNWHSEHLMTKIDWWQLQREAHVWGSTELKLI